METMELKKIFSNYPEIKLVYFFGSGARGDSGPLSDYDFAVYLDEKDNKKMVELKFSLLDKLSRFYKTDKIDLVILNLTQSPELKFQIIGEGKLIFEQEPFKVMVEPKIFNEYFDFHAQLLKYDLTKA